MIDKIRKGRKVAGLIYYLYGPGKSDEHVDPHIVAGWRDPSAIEPPIKPDGKRDFHDLVNLLNAPLHNVGRLSQHNTVWHCVLSAAPGDPLLSDEQWNRIATEFMDRMGLAPRDDSAGVRWVAIRHGPSKDGIDHIHIAATLARQDGALPNTHNDFIRARHACLAIEKQFGLRPTAAADCTAAVRPSRAETEQALRNGRSEPPRITLRRLAQEAAATALSEDDFFARIRDGGAVIRYRNSTTNSGIRTGYAIALAAGKVGTRQQVWFSGGKLAPDLTLPKLRRRWERPRNTGSRAQVPETDLSPRSVRAFLRSAACSAADQARSDTGFFTRLQDSGILIRYRHSDRNPDEITGYALSLPGHADEHGAALWYSGGRLSADLTLPKLRQRWGNGTRRQIVPPISQAERNAIWNDFIRLTSQGAEQLKRLTATDPAAAADTAWATADALRASARAIRGAPGREIQRAADDFDRAARQTYRTVPRPTHAGNGLRTASRLLAVLSASAGPVVRLDFLITSLARLTDAAAQLRTAQQRAHQAAAARTAAERLSNIKYTTAIRTEVLTSETVPAESTPATRVTKTSFPLPLRLQRPPPATRPASQPPGRTTTARRKPRGPDP